MPAPTIEVTVRAANAVTNLASAAAELEALLIPNGHCADEVKVTELAHLLTRVRDAVAKLEKWAGYPAVVGGVTVTGTPSRPRSSHGPGGAS